MNHTVKICQCAALTRPYEKGVGVPFYYCLSRNGGEIVARVKQTLSRRVPATAATLRSALTEFAPALSCHYPGQAGF